jgi:hypothetical protein
MVKQIEMFGNFDKEKKATEDATDKIIPKYVSQDGFIETKIRRGFTEIEKVYDLLFEYIVDGDCHFCGGYVRYMCSPNPSPAKAGDLDIYFKDEGYFKEVKALFLEKGFIIKHENPVSVSFALIDGTESEFFGTPEIQLIKPIEDGAIKTSGDMEHIISHFDFTVIRCGLISSKEALVDADFMHDEFHKILRIKNIHCPISSTLRCMKYARKGYWLPPIQCCRLFFDWEDREEQYRNDIYKFLVEADKGEGLTRDDIEKMERLMRID